VTIVAPSGNLFECRLCATGGRAREAPKTAPAGPKSKRRREKRTPSTFRTRTGALGRLFVNKLEIPDDSGWEKIPVYIWLPNSRLFCAQNWALFWY
jgi:hypothetical protein